MKEGELFESKLAQVYGQHVCLGYKHGSSV